MPDPAQNPSVPTPPPSLAQQATATDPNAPVPAAIQAPINMPQGAPAAMPQQAQPQVKGPSPWQRAVHALLGSQTEYNQTPNGPVPVQVQNKPGQLFRSILAGAILGAGAGTSNAEHNAGSGWGAAGAGAAAAQKNAQMQQQQRQQQAQQQFENQRQVNQDQQEEIRRKAEIALNNMQTLRINKEIQGMDYNQHQKIADMGKASVKPYEDAQIHPVVTGLTESQHEQYIQDHPEATNYDWEPTSVKTVLTKDKDGKEVPNFELSYDAYDPKGKVPVPASTIAEWEKNGVFDRFPEYKPALTDKTLPAMTYGRAKADANKVIADNLAKQNQQLETTLKTTQIDAAKAEIRQRDASAYNESMSAQEKKDAKNKQAALDTAWDHLAAAGNDPSKSPMTAEDRVTIARNAQPLIQDSLNAIKVAANDPSQQDQLPELWNTYHSLARLAQLGGSDNGGGASVPYVDPATGTQYNLPPDKVADFLKAHPNAKKVGESAGPANPLDNLTRDTAVIKNASGATTTIAKSSLDSFLKMHPEFTLVGYGAKPAAAAPLEPQPAAQPNNYQGR